MAWVWGGLFDPKLCDDIIDIYFLVFVQPLNEFLVQYKTSDKLVTKIKNKINKSDFCIIHS